MNSALMIRGSKNWAYCIFSFLVNFSVFQGNLFHFSWNVQDRIFKPSSNIWRMNKSIMGLRLGLTAFILPLFVHFSVYSYFTHRIFYQNFLKFFKLESLNLVYIGTMRCLNV